MSKDNNTITAGAHGFMGFYDQYFGYFDREYEDMTDEEVHEGFKDFSERVCESYVEELQMCLSSKEMNRGKNLPPITKIDYVCQHNPREYNFTTDKIEMLVHVTSKEKFGKWVLQYTEANHEEWDKFLKGLFTSNDGFASWFSNDPEEWKIMSNNYQNIIGIDDGYKPSTYVPLQIILGFYLWMEHTLLDFPGDCGTRYRDKEREKGKFYNGYWDTLQGRWEQYSVSEIY